MLHSVQMGTIKIADKRKQLFIKLFAGGLIGQLGAFALQYAGFALGNNDFGILGFFTFMVAVPLLSFAVAAFMRPPNWLTLGSTGTIAELAAFDLYSTNQQLDLVTIIFFTLGAGFIFVLAFWTDQKVSRILGRKLSFFITAAFVTCIWLGVAWVGTTIIFNIQSYVYQRRTQAELSSRLAALDFRLYLPRTMPSGYSIRSIIPISDSDVKTFHAPRSLIFTLSRTDDLEDITLNEFSVPASFNPPRECGPYSAHIPSFGPSPVPLPCQQFTQASDVKVYSESYDFPGEYHFYFRKDNTEFTISTNNTSLSPEQLQSLVAGLAVIGTTGLPADLLQEN